MIRHQAIGRDAYPGPVVGLSQNLLTRGVVRGRIKQRESSNSAVEDMIGEISSRETWTAWHAHLLPKPSSSCHEKTPDPFSVPPNSAMPIPLKPGRKDSWLADFMAWRSEAPFSQSRCSPVHPMPRKWRWSRSCANCKPGDFASWTASNLHHTSRPWAPKPYPARIFLITAVQR